MDGSHDSGDGSASRAGARLIQTGRQTDGDIQRYNHSYAYLAIDQLISIYQTGRQRNELRATAWDGLSRDEICTFTILAIITMAEVRECSVSALVV